MQIGKNLYSDHGSPAFVFMDITEPSTIRDINHAAHLANLTLAQMLRRSVLDLLDFDKDLSLTQRLNARLAASDKTRSEYIQAALLAQIVADEAA